jgi:hypothetical protein
MTLSEFQDLFKNIRTEIIDLIKANVTLASTAVYGREVVDGDESTWYGRLTAPNGSTHCWTVSYAGCPGLDDEKNPTATETFMPMFRIVGYRGYSFGTDAANSSDQHMDEVNKIRWAFMNNATLTLPDYVESHSGFIDQTVLGKIDTKPIHISKIDLGVQLHPIPYIYL